MAYVVLKTNNKHPNIADWLQHDKFIRRKVYDMSFGDIVPNIMADALGIDIIIIEKRVNETTHTCTCVNGNTGNRVERKMGSSIFVYKCGSHYDGLSLVCHTDAQPAVDNITGTL